LSQRASDTTRSRARTAPTNRADARRPGVTLWARTQVVAGDQRSRARAASIARRV
jgi:hypothetical protein